MSLGPGMNIRSWFQRPLMTAVDGFVLSGLDFSGEAADSEAEDGTGGEPARAAPWAPEEAGPSAPEEASPWEPGPAWPSGPAEACP